MKMRGLLGSSIIVATLHCQSASEEPSVRPPEAPKAAAAAAKSLAVELPERADGTVRIGTPAGLSLSFRLRGAGGSAGRAMDGAKLYAGATSDGGNLVLRASPRVVEDFVRYERKPVREGEMLRYDLDVSNVAGLRYVAGVLELLDASGTPRLRMAPPFVETAAKERRPARVSIEGCAYDEGPAAPWRRAVTKPGARACVLLVRWSLRDEEYPATVDPAWVLGTEMVSARSFHQAAVLDDGRLLVVGGQRSLGPGAELYDPATESWAAVAGATSQRIFFKAVKLADGSVLAVGGTDTSLLPRSAAVDLYDPSVGAFRAIAPLPEGRAGHSLTALPDGRALLVGGFTGGDVTADAAIFQKQSGFVPVKALPHPRGHHAAALLPDGRVLVTGGEKCCNPMPFEALATTEIYDPARDLWTAGPKMSSARYDHTVDVLADGRVVVAGGASLFFDNGLLGSIELLDAAATKWTLVGSLGSPRVVHASTLLANGKVLFSGTAGKEFANGTVTLTETFDPAGGTIAAAGDTKEYRTGQTSTVLLDGRVFLAGGGALGPPLRSTEVFGDKLGDPCGPGDCVNGACVAGVCCATVSACTPDAGTPEAGVDASKPGASAPAAASTSYHACGAAPGGASQNCLAWLALALLAGGALLRRATSSQGGRGERLP